jgi:pimeloyl-ACP methyl ester carboxylesterase
MGTSLFDEPAFIARVESANTDEFSDLLRQPTKLQERALRAYFGDGRYQRLHSKALRSFARRGQEPDGNVIVLHGMMGSELSLDSRATEAVEVWPRITRIMAGSLSQLQLSEDGRSGVNAAIDVRATGIMKRHYGELLLALSERWRVRAFWYDWRKDIRLAAAELEANISSSVADDQPVHLVAHSMGGLVARSFIKSYPSRWDSMWDVEGHGSRGGRLIMLGTPNHGSFAIPQMITGVEGLVRKLTLLDLVHSQHELLDVLNSFPALYQMLPSPFTGAGSAELYDSQTYGELHVGQSLLTTAREHHEALADVVDPDRMLQVVGTTRPTPTGLDDPSRIASLEGYAYSMCGDGKVPHALSGLMDASGRRVPMYYVEEGHGGLPANDRVLAALPQLLDTGGTAMLPRQAPRTHEGVGVPECRALVAKSQSEEEELLQMLVTRLRPRGSGGRSREDRPTLYLSSQERAVEEILTSGFLSYADDEDDPQTHVIAPPFPPAGIEIALVCGGIEDIPDGAPALSPDAVAVGHYIGVRPQAAELALDTAISKALPGQAEREDGILAQFGERGIIHGERGQVFFLSDPRVDPTADGRLVAVVGMGYPGRFGMPELTLATRELCWSLGRMGKRHLRTVLIGAGNGNIPIADAVNAWIGGIRQALAGSGDDGARRLQRITFVERDPRRLAGIDEAIWRAKLQLEEQHRLQIEYRRLHDVLDPAESARLDDLAHRFAREEVDRAFEGGGRESSLSPTRVTLSFEGGTYTFGAITENASLPERSVPLDPLLVGEANDELAAEWRPAMQEERGRLMERLLIPADLREHLAGSAPVVMALDTATARIHWEMVAQSSSLGDWPAEASGTGDDLRRAFLGTRRGFTRQLVTAFAPTPQPPPPPRRVLRVLVVADPAEDEPLPGAEEEGVEVADLFERFNEVWGPQSDSRVTVVRLLGSSEATRTHVLRHLMLRSYDLLHYAGHCVYDEQEYSRQGWVFTGGHLLTPNELNRIDRIPKFVFSNGCESGITPDRSEDRTSALAPGFAESFFQRGVANFVCTAWPVDDGAARDFALTLYSSLLGLERGDSGRYAPVPPKPMYEAMHEARLAIFGTVAGARAWGAYQHYGNPYFYLFDPRTIGKASLSYR